MLVASRGIVLHQTDYSETSLIVKIYTEHFGLQSYIVKGVRKKGARIKRNVFSPLSLVELVAYRKENSGLGTMKEVSCYRQFHSITDDIVKSSILLFMNELLYRSIPGEMADPLLFEFISGSLHTLDQQEGNLATFPLNFSMKLATFLGFEPRNNYSAGNNIFLLEEGMFTSVQPDTPECIFPPDSKVFAALLESEGYDFSIPDYKLRNALLDKVLDYFRLHLPAFPVLKSPQVLATVLND